MKLNISISFSTKKYSKGQQVSVRVGNEWVPGEVLIVTQKGLKVKLSNGKVAFPDNQDVKVLPAAKADKKPAKPAPKVVKPAPKVAPRALKAERKSTPKTVKKPDRTPSKADTPTYEPIDVYRIEHKDSKQGPFVHGGQISEVVNLGIDSSNRLMTDIDELPEVQAILENTPKAMFGFTTKQQAESFVRNWPILKKHGFVLSKYHVKPLFVADDGQVVFNAPSKSKVGPEGYVKNPFPTSVIKNVVFHGTPVKEVFSKFKRPLSGVHITPYEDWAQMHYGSKGQVIPLYVNVKKLMVLDPNDKRTDPFYDWDFKGMAKVIGDLEEEGYDACQYGGESDATVLFSSVKIVNARTGEPM